MSEPRSFDVSASLELEVDKRSGLATLRAKLNPPVACTTHCHYDIYMDVTFAGAPVRSRQAYEKEGYLRMNKIFQYTTRGSFREAAYGDVGGGGQLSVARITGFEFPLEGVRDINGLYHGPALFLVMLRAYVRRYLAACQIARWWLRVSSDPATRRGRELVLRRLASDEPPLKRRRIAGV